MSFGVVFGQMLVLLAMMLAGFFCYKKEWIADETSGRLSKLVVNVFNPVLVVNGVLGQSSAEAGSGVIWNLIFIVAYFAILMVLSYVVPIIFRPASHLKSIYRLMTIFANVGFMGIPVIRSIFGNESMIYVAFYILAYNIMVYTCGMHLSGKAAEENRIKQNSYLEAMAANGTGKASVKKDEQQVMKETFAYRKPEGKIKAFLKQFINPGVVASLVAVTIFAFGIEMPEPVMTFCDYMGNVTIPMSMMLIGVSLAQTDLKEVFADGKIYLFVLLRMVVLPILLALALKGLVATYAIDPVVFGVFIVEFGMPVGSIIAMMVKNAGADSAYCTKGVVVSTLASIVTIPLICMFL